MTANAGYFFLAGPPAVMRMHCRKCKDETLHTPRGGCAHCGTHPRRRKVSRDDSGYRYGRSGKR